MEKEKPFFLDTDSSLLEHNLKIVKNVFEDDLKTVLDNEKQQFRNSLPYKIVKPTPGMCIKTYKEIDNEKLFINICETDEIPSPPSINETELMVILSSNKPDTYKVPMSISELRPSLDKNKKTVQLCDVAINPNFMKKINEHKLFLDFLIQIIIEGIEYKYSIVVMHQWIALKNRKCMGTLVTHRIENRDIKKVIKEQNMSGYTNMVQNNTTPTTNNKVLIEEINSNCNSNIKKNPDTVVKAVKQSNSMEDKKNDIYIPNPSKIAISRANTTKPEYILQKRPKEGNPEEIIMEVYLPDCVTSNEILLEVGEDRILIEARKRGYLLDGLLDYKLNQDTCNAKYNSITKILTVNIPVIA